MYKNFNITEEEKKQILESHKRYGYGKPLNEQSSGWVDDKYTLVERICKKGNTDLCVEWWNKNSHKKSNDIMDIMDCHEYHESTKMLVDLVEEASEILQLLRKENSDRIK